jgi:nuclear receptor interaction protein
MPYSNDRTIVSATDDVKIFDIEHSGHSALRTGSNRSNTGSSRSIAMSRDNVTLTRGDTDAKDFRCHSDTVKRIVTEDNPFYFLTCSQDGDVRQWDVRAPSTLYPPQRDSMIPSWARDEDAVGNVPPPLISYSRYGIELNTVSCSPSQPHLIALGGSHLHCFVHDRRMLGRDVNNERGAKLSSIENWSEHDDELLGKATRCVKKFAPNGKQRMKRTDSGHITACKISDAVPTELIVSWSGDHIYGFDMLRASDAREEVTQTKVQNGDLSHRVNDTDRKRKRPKSKSSALSQDGAERAGSRQRTQSTEEDLALRVTYDNGQSEDLRIQSPAQTTRMSQEDLNDLRATDHYRIAKAWLTISKRIFDLGEHGETGLKLAFTSILGLANSIISDMDNIDRTWGYPVDPDYVDVDVQNRLRDSRAATRRFVQAAGTLARVMGGQLLTGNTSDALIAQYFASIQPAPRERELPQHEQFGYDCLKAILLWLDSGPGAVVEGFSGRSSNSRLPIPYGSDIDAIQDHLIPYLSDLASEEPIVNVDESKFGIDDDRILFSTESDAINAFAHAITIPFEDLTGTAGSTSSDMSQEEPTQSRATAKRRWAFLVGRGVLLNAAKDLSFRSIDCAYGGRGVCDKKIRAEEREMRNQHDDINSLEDEGRACEAELNEASHEANSEQEETSSSSPTEDDEEEEEEEEEDSEDDEEDSDGDIDSDEEAEEDDDEYDTDEDSDGLRRTRSGRMLWRSDFSRNRHQRWKAELDVPCAPHTRVYTGHANTKTVKDVNFFGLQDEYVVSGSDCGNLFLWDRKTAELVNIIEGDGEVVNVIQGTSLPLSSSVTC